MIRFALDTLNKWINYSNEKLDIIAYSEKTTHNTITPIVRKKNGLYEMDLVLRNNLTSEKFSILIKTYIILKKKILV